MHIVDRVLMGVVFGIYAFEVINDRLTRGDLNAFLMSTPYRLRGAARYAASPSDN